MRLLFYTWIITVYACNTPNTQKPANDKDVHQTIAACILDVFGSADSAKYYYKVYPPFDDPDYKLTKYNDSMFRLLDTAKTYFVITDTLGGVDNDDQRALNKVTRLESVDTVRSAIQTIDTANLSGILGISVRTAPEHINDELRLIGYFHFSRIVFDKSKTRAWVALNFREGKVGYGDIFSLEKIKGNWKVVKRERTWIS